MMARIRNELPDISSYPVNHFMVRCNIPRDLYSDAIDVNITYLWTILSEHGDSYRMKLNRQGFKKEETPC